MRKTAAVRKYSGDPASLVGLRVGAYARASKAVGDASVEGQADEAVAWAERHGCVLVGDEVFIDNNLPASRFGKKVREEFVRLVEYVRRGEVDVLWFTELSRQQRRLGVFSELRDLCRDRGVLWVIGGRVYDLSDPLEGALLGYQAVGSEMEAELISARVTRGAREAAKRGVPAGPMPYGYRRIHDPLSGLLVRQEPDDEARTAVSADGVQTSYSRAGIVRELFARVAAGETLSKLARELNERGVPTPGGGRVWHPTTVRALVLNRAYLGDRIHNGDLIKSRCWVPLVREAEAEFEAHDELFWTVNRVLSDPARRTWKPGRARHLASSITRCGECGGQMMARNRNGKAVLYQCNDQGCTAISLARFDEYISAVVVAWLERADGLIAEQTSSGDKALAAARAEIERLRGELEGFITQAMEGKISATSFALIEPGLQAKINAAEAKLTDEGVEPVLRGRTGADAAEQWAAMDVDARRELLRTVARIEVFPVDGRKGVPIPDRLRWTWLLGDVSEAA